jgi:N6-adenosine-specific RNA methylase IME4
MLPDALMVMRAWGFSYRTNLAWVKDRGRGKGWFLKSRHELLLIGVKSHTPHPSTRPDSAFFADRPEQHSQKPEQSYEIIENMYLQGPRLEMFSRKRRPGWEAHGNQLGD